MNIYYNYSTDPSIPSSCSKSIVQIENYDSVVSLEYHKDETIINDKNILILRRLDPLPKSLKRLDISNYGLIEELSDLPDSLEYINVSNNKIKQIPNLPYFLASLNCSSNHLIELPTLPNSLRSLWCYSNQLRQLPNLPHNLEQLSCAYNNLTNLVNLPLTLTYLDCSNCNLISLDVSYLTNLIELKCNENKLSKLSLPNSLTKLYCDSNYLTELPKLPDTLTVLYCNSNHLTELSSLPNSLIRMSCSSNKIIELVSLPESLKFLDCSSNQLSKLPRLPNLLFVLNCSTNSVRLCPDIKHLVNLHKIICSNNLIIDIPILPKQLLNNSTKSNIEKTLCKCESLDGKHSCIVEKQVNFDNNPFINIYKNHPNVNGQYFNHTSKNKFSQFIQKIGNLFK